MDEEVKRRRKEREQQAVEQRLNEERKRKMEQDNKHLLANLFNPKPMLNQSLAQSLAQSHIKQKLNQNALQRTQAGSIPLLQRMQNQAQSTLQQPSQNLALFSLQRNPSQTQQRTHNNWPNNSTTTSTTNQGPLPNMVNLSSSLPQFYPQSFLSSFQQPKNPSLSLHQSPNLSSKNPLDEILDLTVSSPSPSPDSTEAGLHLDGLAGHSATFGDDFNLESLISQNAPNAQHAAQIQQPLLLQQQQQHLQAAQQQNHNLLANNHHQDLLDFLDLPLSPQMPTQKASPSPSTSSCSSSTSATSSVSNNMGPHMSAGLLPTSSLIPTTSSPSLFSSTSSSSSLFSNSPSHFSSPYLLPQSDSHSLPNGHCSSGALDVREALNSMLQAGPDRKSVIKYRPQD